MAGGCDRETKPAAQPQPTASASPSEAPSTPAAAIDRSHKGEPLPQFTFKDKAGKAIALPSLKGKPVLLNLWATWCAPCVVELPQLEKLAADSAGGLQVVTIAQDMDDGAKVAPFLESRALTKLAPWLDPKNDLPVHYSATTLPTTIYYDAAGKEVWRLVGGHDWTTPATTALLAEAR